LLDPVLALGGSHFYRIHIPANTVCPMPRAANRTDQESFAEAGATMQRLPFFEQHSIKQ